MEHLQQILYQAPYPNLKGGVKKTTPTSPLLSPQTREISFHPIGWVGGGVLLEVFYGTQYDHILPYEKDSYVNIGRLRFIYTTEMLISIME